MPDAAIWFIAVWLFAVGGIVGSFLNVVIYRLPLGISIVYPPSRCPKCEKRIPWFDNVPIFGWIVLGGRCRQCHNPISARYPIVEAITASMFALVAVVEMRQANIDQFCAIYPYHLLLLCTLLCAGLIEYDGNQPPLKLFLPALAVGIVAPLFLPALRPMAACPGLSATVRGAVDGLAGLGAGGLWGSIAWGALAGRKPVGLMRGLICVGLFLGWQAVSVIAVGTAVLGLVAWAIERFSPRVRIPVSMSLGIATLVCILAMNWIASL
jgi:leader peptidase (prepilin peptidase)/N-methyltransferase